MVEILRAPAVSGAALKNAWVFGFDATGNVYFTITGSDGAALPPEYALFGQVTDGLESTVTAMAAAGTPGDGVPSEPIQIQSVRIVEA